MLKSKEQKIYEGYVKATEKEINLVATVLADITATVVEYSDKRRRYLLISQDSKTKKEDLKAAYIMCDNYTTIINDLEKTKSRLEADFRGLEDTLIRLKGEAK